jgi:nitroreductase
MKRQMNSSKPSNYALSTKPSQSSVPAGKYADTLPGVDELFRARWSPRSFSSRTVSNEDLETILDAARWAASSFNEQPWRFVVATKADPEAYNAMLSVLVSFNQEWAKSAPVLILTAALKNFSHNGKPNHHALHDTGAALAHMMLQATALGLHAHAMAGFDHAKAYETLGIPAEFELGAAVAIGYLASPDLLPNDQMKQQELAARSRKPLSELAFKGRWGQPLVK